MSPTSSPSTAAEPPGAGDDLRLSPDEGLRAAHALGHAGNWAGAVEALRRVLAGHPDHPRTLAYLGFYLERQGRLREAREAAVAALSRAPNDAECHRTLAVVLRSSGAHRDALAQFGEAIRLDPEGAYHRYGRALLHTNLRRAREAQADFEAAAERAPNDPFILGNASEALFLLGRPRPARAFAERAFACGPEHPSAQSARARFLLVDGRHAEARDLYGAAVAGGLTDPLTLAGLIEARLCRHRVFALWSRTLAWTRGGWPRALAGTVAAVAAFFALVIACAHLWPPLVLAVIAAWAAGLGSLVAFCELHERRLAATRRPVRLGRRF